jgi:hypothetical protein
VAKEIGLREMAKKICVSPTYLSKVERDEFSAATPPPSVACVGANAGTAAPLGVPNSRHRFAAVQSQ